MYMGRSPAKGFWYGVYQNNAAAVDYWVTNSNNSGNTETQVKSRASGGVGDIYIFFNSKESYGIEDLIQKYHKYIVGTPVLVPQWAFGWH